MTRIVAERSTTDLAQRIATAVSEQYEVVHELGQGGMAVVYLARDLRHDRFVALKVFRPEIASAVGTERFLREIKTVAALQHPHILSLIDSGTAEGLLFYVMPYVEGESLRQKLAREKQLGLDDTVVIASHVASALDYAHRRGVVHRDIKPENILLHEGGALLADFGIALAVDSVGGGRLTETGFSLGTPQYMSPEQAAGDRELDSRSDTYALGCVVYELLTGEPPHTGATAQAVFSKMMTAVPTQIRVIRQSVPEHVEAAVERALHKVPADRFATTLGFAEALVDPDRPITGPRSRTGASSVKARPLVGRHRRKVLLGFGIPLLAAAALMLGVVLTRWLGSGEGGASGITGGPSSRQVTFSGDATAVSLAPDGEMFAYLVDDRRTLVLKDIGGDVEFRLVESGEPLGQPRWSRDGSTVVSAGSVGGRRGVFTISRLGGEPQLMVGGFMEGPGSPGIPLAYGFAAGHDSYAVACCGAMIYLGQDPASITRVSRDSFVVANGMLIDLRSSVRRIQVLSVSPDGAWIAFVGATSDQQAVLGTVASDGSSINIVQQADGIGWGGLDPFGSPQWTRAGDGLLYSHQSGGGANILSVAIDPRTGGRRGEPRLVLPNLPADLTFGIVSEQGRLAYAGGGNRSHLELAQRGVTDSERLTTGTWSYHSPAIAPDGTQVAYVKGNGADQDVYILSLMDRNERRLTNDHEVLGALSWSPDGTRLAYSAVTADGAVPRVVDLATGQVTQLEAGVTTLGQAPQWGAAGRSLLFGRMGVGLVAYDLDTQTESRVRIPRLGDSMRDAVRNRANLRTPGAETPAAAPVPRPDSMNPVPDRGAGGGLAARVRMPVVAPDGGRFAAFFGFASEVGLWVLSTDGSVARKLVPDLAWPLLWTEDDTIFFVRDPFGGSGNTQIERVSTGGGKTEVVLQLPFRCEFGNLTISRDGELVVCAVREGTSDVWVIDGLDLTVR
jgi:serine/threonine-protein kinase